MTKNATGKQPFTRDEAMVSRFAERFAAVMMEAGIPRMPARVLATLLATDSGSLTAAELSSRLQVSPAAISGAVRYLIQFDLVSRERKPGSRRDSFRLFSNLWYEAITRQERVLTRWADSAREGAEVLGIDTPAGARMSETREFFDFLYRETPAFMEQWRTYRDRTV